MDAFHWSKIMQFHVEVLPRGRKRGGCLFLQPVEFLATTLSFAWYLGGWGKHPEMAQPVDTGTDGTGRKRGLMPGGAMLILLVLIVAVVIMITRDQGDDRRAPAPTPTNENVHQVAP
jgi:hypothetical protein